MCERRPGVESCSIYEFFEEMCKYVEWLSQGWGAIKHTQRTFCSTSLSPPRRGKGGREGGGGGGRRRRGNRGKEEEEQEQEQEEEQEEKEQEQGRRRRGKW